MKRRTWAAVLVTAAALVSGRGAGAVEPDALPAAIWWRAAPDRGLALDPLAALRIPRRLRLDAEWAPLYSGPDGARFEQERRSIRLATPPRAWRGAVELGIRSAVARGGADPAWIGAEHPLGSTATAALGRAGGGYEAAGVISTHDRRIGFGLAGSVRRGRARASLDWSALPQQGRSEVRWNEVDVLAQGGWRDQRVGWEIEIAAGPGLDVVVGQRALDRRAEPSGASREPGDRIEPALAWRASHLRLGARSHGLDLRASAEYGEGRESIRFSRAGVAYGIAAGPVTHGLAAIEIESARRQLAVRGWIGRWSGDARASLALWPFDAVAALAGTRRLARSDAELEHRGLAIERTRTSGSGLEGGLALWSLAPRARYESWQATLMGVGRDDVSTGETDLRSALAIGARIAGSCAWRGARARLELVQWVPVRIARVGDRDGGGEPGPGPGTGDASGNSGSTRGGTIVRFSLLGG